MPYIKIWIHLVWSTKKRYPYLTADIRQKVFTHMRENAKLKNIYVDFINGYTDHVHCLDSLTQEQNIATIVKLIKGESAFWINKNNLCKENFLWQNEYFAVPVSESGVKRVREYIKNLETHHAKKTFHEEYNEIITKYEFGISSPSG